MKAEEIKGLRIGNLLQGENGNILSVDYITKDEYGNFIVGLLNEVGGTDKHQKNPIHSYDIDKLKAVTLTEQWLLYFGFTKGEEKIRYGNGFDYQPKDVFTTFTDYILNKHIKYQISHWSFKGTIEDESSLYFQGNQIRNIDSVHELQNIIFELSRQELKVKTNG